MILKRTDGLPSVRFSSNTVRRGRCCSRPPGGRHRRDWAASGQERSVTAGTQACAGFFSAALPQTCPAGAPAAGHAPHPAAETGEEGTEETPDRHPGMGVAVRRTQFSRRPDGSAVRSPVWSDHTGWSGIHSSSASLCRRAVLPSASVPQEALWDRRPGSSWPVRRCQAPC